MDINAGAENRFFSTKYSWRRIGKITLIVIVVYIIAVIGAYSTLFWIPAWYRERAIENSKELLKQKFLERGMEIPDFLK